MASSIAPEGIRIAVQPSDADFVAALATRLETLGYVGRPRPEAPAAPDAGVPDLWPKDGEPGEPPRRIVVLGDTPWPQNPFAQDEGADRQPPLIVRLSDTPIPEFLFPVLDKSGQPAWPIPIVDVFRHPARGPETVAEALRATPLTPEIEFAAAVIMGGVRGVTMLDDLGVRGVATTAPALLALHPGLRPTLADAIVAISANDPAALRAATGAADWKAAAVTPLCDGASLLHLAAILPDRLDLVRILLDEGGMPIDVTGNNGATPLHYAAWSNQALSLWLIERGADPRHIRPDGKSVPDVAAWRGQTALLQVAVQAGCDLRITQSSMGHPMVGAASTGHMEAIELLLAHDASLVDLPVGAFGIGSTDPAWSPDAPGLSPFMAWRRRQGLASTARGWTPLMCAAHKQQLEACERLLAAGAQPNRASQTGLTALHLAVTQFDADQAPKAQARGVKLLLRLLEAGADPTAADEQGQTALHMAAGRGFKAALEPLIGAGADVEAKDAKGRTPMHFAAVSDPAVIAKLAGLGGDVNVADNTATRPLALALSFGGPEQVRALLAAGAEVDTPDDQGFTPLMVACAADATQMTELLLAHGADPNRASTRGVRALQIAAIRGHAELARVLIAAGAALDALDDTGETALREAVRHKRPEVFEMLLAAGADPWLAGKSALSAAAAAFTDTPSPASALLLAQFDPAKATPEQSQLALAGAAVGGDEALVRLLQSQGRSLDAAVAKAGRPVALTAVYGPLSMLRLLHDLGAEMNWPPGVPSALTYAAEAGRVDAIDLLIELGARVNQPGAKLMSPLHYAATNGKAAAAKRLIERGAYVDPVNASAQTPLHLAAHFGRADCIAVLAEAGAVVDALDEDGQTPLHHAAQHGAEAVQALLQRGAARDALDSKQRTPLLVATEGGKLDAAKALLADGADPRWSGPEGYTASDIAAQKNLSEFVRLFESYGAPPPAPFGPQTAEADFLDWRDLEAGEEAEFLSAVGARDQGRLAQPFRAAPVSFLTDALVVAATDPTAIGGEAFFVWSRDRDEVVEMDWSSGPLYRANERFGWNVDAGTVCDYLRYFFFFVPLPRFRLRLVEPGDPLPWRDSVGPRRGAPTLLPAQVEAQGEDGFKVTGSLVAGMDVMKASFFIALRSVELPVGGSTASLSRSQPTMTEEAGIAEGLPFRTVLPPAPRR